MAGGYEFRLQVVERVRRQKRDGRRRDVSQVLREIADIQRDVEHATAALKSETEAIRGVHREARVDIGMMRGHQYYVSRLHRQIEQSGLEIAGKHEELRQKQALLAEAAKELKVIEKLRERQYQRYLIERDRRERAVEDETALQSFARRKSQAGLAARV